MRGLGSTRASRAWLGVALAGLVVVALALALVPRLGGAQQFVDAARPALTAERVAGERAGIDLVSRYVELVDPLVTRGSGAGADYATLIGLVARRTSPTEREVAAALRREAPRTDALLRAVPLTAVDREIARLTRFLATRLNLPDEDLATTLEQSFPRLAQMLTALRAVAGGWNDVPGIEGLTRFDGRTPVRTVPQFRTYLSADLVAAAEREAGDLRAVAGRGGIGAPAWVLLVAGLVALAGGLVQALRAASTPPGRISWGVVAALGVLLMVLVPVVQLFPRMRAAEDVAAGLRPAFAARRVQGARAGVDMLHAAIRFGDPIATRRGGAARDARALVTFVSRRTNLPPADVRAALRRRAPRTIGLLEAIPLSGVAAEVPNLLSYLGRRLKLDREEVVATLRRRTPRLARSLLAMRPVSEGWNEVPGTAGLTRFDGTPVRTVPAFDDLLARDVVPVLETQREHFGDLADPWPPLTYLPPIVFGLGVLAFFYGLVMTDFGTRR